MCNCAGCFFIVFLPGSYDLGFVRNSSAADNKMPVSYDVGMGNFNFRINRLFLRDYVSPFSMCCIAFWFIWYRAVMKIVDPFLSTQPSLTWFASSHSRHFVSAVMMSHNWSSKCSSRSPFLANCLSESKTLPYHTLQVLPPSDKLTHCPLVASCPLVTSSVMLIQMEV